MKECARQADYTIPQAHEKDVEIPKTKDGEDLGVGTGWWFESEIVNLSQKLQSLDLVEGSNGRKLTICLT